MIFRHDWIFHETTKKKRSAQKCTRIIHNREEWRNTYYTSIPTLHEAVMQPVCGYIWMYEFGQPVGKARGKRAREHLFEHGWGETEPRKSHGHELNRRERQKMRVDCDITYGLRTDRMQGTIGVSKQQCWADTLLGTQKCLTEWIHWGFCPFFSFFFYFCCLVKRNMQTDVTQPNQSHQPESHYGGAGWCGVRCMHGIRLFPTFYPFFLSLSLSLRLYGFVRSLWLHHVESRVEPPEKAIECFLHSFAYLWIHLVT